MNLEALRARLGELVALNNSIVSAAADAGRDLSDDEGATIDANLTEIDSVQAGIARLERVQASSAAAGQGQGRRSAPEAHAAAPAAGSRSLPAAPKDHRSGFNSLGEFAGSVKAACTPNTTPDKRLLAAATTFSSEGVGSDGGFAVPPEFRRDIWAKVTGEDSLLSRTDKMVTAANSMTFPKDETTPWQTSGGVQAYWESEASQITASKVALDQSTVRLHKLTALVPVTEELLEDAPGMDAYLRNKAPQKMQAKLNTAIIRGTGVGQPLGLLNAGCTVSVAKESGQTADTILFANIVKMWSRMYAPCRRNAVWLINQDIEPQLLKMAFDPAATAGMVPAYMPAGGLSASPFATLMGRPVVPVEACSTLGDQGDIALVDLTQYLSVTKGSDVRTDVSIHLYFDQALTTFRFIMRVAGMPWWGSAITPQNGNATRSCFVTLDERS